MTKEERCQATHEAIKAGRTKLASIGTQIVPDEPYALEIYNCPHCGSSISRRVPKEKDPC